MVIGKIEGNFYNMPKLLETLTQEEINSIVFDY